MSSRGYWLVNATRLTNEAVLLVVGPRLDGERTACTRLPVVRGMIRIRYVERERSCLFRTIPLEPPRGAE